MIREANKINRFKDKAVYLKGMGSAMNIYKYNDNRENEYLVCVETHYSQLSWGTTSHLIECDQKFKA